MSGKKSAIVGKANELITLGLLLPYYPDTMLSAHEQSSHDLIITMRNQVPTSKKTHVSIRAQVKTAQTSISFTGGNRGGVDRNYDPRVNESKQYSYSLDNSDIVIGIHKVGFGAYELYFVPSAVIEKIDQKSIAVSKIAFTKNKLEYIQKCADLEPSALVDEYLVQLN